MTTTASRSISIDHRVPSVMRDGATLYCDVYRPTKSGRYPVIVERVAYELTNRLAPYAEFYASRGYVFVGQNTRGTFWSEGEFKPGVDDGWGDNKDGYDTIEWAATQPWSDGNIATMDGSWSGLTQNLLAPTRPPHLRTMFLRMAPAGPVDGNGGIAVLGMRMNLLNTTLRFAKHPSASERLRSFVPKLEHAVANPAATVNTLPASAMPVLDDIYGDVDWRFGLKPNDPAKLDLDATRMSHEIDVPIFHLGGWFDGFLESTLAMYKGVRDCGFSELARNNQRLLIGPWVHGPMEPNNPKQGDLDFGEDAVLGINEFRLKWFDYWLKGKSNDVPDLPSVRLFVMGENHWRDFDAWPPEGATEVKLYLRRSRSDSGSYSRALDLEPPTDGGASTSYDYDPFNPLPQYTGGKQGFHGLGPVDMTPSESENVVFTSSRFERALTVIGPIKLRLWAKSSAKDTDWFATLTDVWPDGRSIRVQDGALRARYREGFAREVLMEPGKPYLFDVDMRATAQRFEAGHRIRLAITSSRFPPNERNMNTGGENAHEMTGIVAHNTILHDRDHPSHLVLPVMS